MSPFGVYVSIKSKGSCYGLEQGISKNIDTNGVRLGELRLP